MASKVRLWYTWRQYAFLSEGDNVACLVWNWTIKSSTEKVAKDKPKNKDESEITNKKRNQRIPKIKK